jgi:hypothetical protein
MYRDISPVKDPDQCFKIHALVCTYNDHVSLPFTLDSVKDVVDSIIVADGAYKLYYQTYKKYFPDSEPWSTDGTLEMLNIFPDLPPVKLIQCPDGKPWKNQCVKRTALLDAVPDKDWFIVLDSDEMLYSDSGGVVSGVYEIMQSGCIAGRVPLYNVGLDISGMITFWHPRIFLKLPGMHYSRKHWLLCDYAERVVESEYPVYATNTFVLTHLRVLRHHRRIAPHMSYMLKLSGRGWLEPGSPEFKQEKEYPVEEKTREELNWKTNQV